MSDTRQDRYPWAKDCPKCKSSGRSTREVYVNNIVQRIACDCATCGGRGYVLTSLSFWQFCGVSLKGAFTPGELRYLHDLDTGRAP